MKNNKDKLNSFLSDQKSVQFLLGTVPYDDLNFIMQHDLHAFIYLAYKGFVALSAELEASDA